VDDDADFRAMLRSALQIAGYSVGVARNGRQAVQAQRHEPADILITDIFMPDADGFEAIDSFRREFPGTRIVVVSGGAQFTKRDYLPDAALIGVDATLQKPFEIETLLETLKSLPG
jgi:CheY-like chemotaxis protein